MFNFKDELLGLAGDPEADSVFKNQDLNMDVLYRTGETHQVQFYVVQLFQLLLLLLNKINDVVCD